MRGTGKTVFSGSSIEEFGVEILGVLENIGPQQSLILARLSGGPLEKTGVMQGMSGSPVYLDGRLAGAVAMAFSYSKEPIAGIRPIEEMLRVEPRPLSRIARIPAPPRDGNLAALFPPARDVMAAGARMVDIATPISFAGFTRNTLEYFAPQLRALGLEPMQGLSGGGNVGTHMGDPAAVKPGSMISVQLLAGDMSVGADGTVTYVDGKRIYAFGHRFLSIGATDLPFARADVLTLLPNLATSFKISAPRELMGTIMEDRSTAVAGELGRRAAMIPLSMTVMRKAPSKVAARQAHYDIRMVSDPVLSPFLMQAAVFSAIDATEQTLGGSTFAIRGKIEFAGGQAPVKLDNIYSGDFNLPAQVSLATAMPLAYIMQSGFEKLQLKSVALEIDSFDRKRQLQIDQVWASKREVRPGEKLDITVVLTGENGLERTRTVSYQVPIGAPTGPLQITAADANTINLTEFRQLVATPPRSPLQLVTFMNALRPNTNAYVRIWRAEPNYEVQGETLPDPPPSLALILARTQASLSGSALAAANSRIAEFEIGAGDMAIAGSKTIQVDVKE
jgi:hypothetical protein